MPTAQPVRTDERPRSRGAQFDRHQFVARVCVAASLGIAAIALPHDGQNRLLAGLFLLVVVVPAHFLIRRLAKVPNPTGWLDLLAIVSGTAVAAMEPGLWPPALLFQMLTLGGVLAILRPRWTMSLCLLALGSMTAVAWWYRVPGAFELLVVGAVLSPVFIIGSVRRAASVRRSTYRMDAAVQSLPMAVWEARVEGGGEPAPDATALATTTPNATPTPALAATGREGSRPEVRLQAVVGRLAELFGRDTGELLARGLAGDVHPDDRRAYLARFAPGFDLDGAPELEYRYQRADGVWVWLRDRLTRTEAEGATLVRGVTVDVTTVRANELGVRRQSRIVQAMAASTIVLDRDPDDAAGWLVVQLTDPLGVWNPAAGDAVGRPFATAFAPLAQRATLLRALDASDEADLDDLLPTRRLGPLPLSLGGRSETGSVELEVVLLPGAARAVLVHDVTERERATALLRHQARHDNLTGLLNRAALHELIATALDRDQDLALLLIDLNDFKEVNDTLGHQVGDEYLGVIARRLLGLTGRNEHAVRLGGDEFALLLIEPAPDRVTELTDHVVAQCREPVDIDAITIAGSASAGIVTSRDLAVALGAAEASAAERREVLSADALLRCADLAMYRAKETHAGACAYRTDMDRSAEQLHLLGALQRAFAEDEFVLHLQPKVELRSGRVVGAEGLVRWNHPELGVLHPALFLDLIMVSGYADDLVQTTLRRAGEALRLLPDHLGLAINVTAQNVRNRQLPALCRDLLAVHRVSAERLTIEITESQVLDTSGVVEAVVTELAASGVKVSVDDFGTGYSSLTHLRALPLSELKIDRQFVDPLLTSTEDQVIVRAMIELAHNLGLCVVAEGVEDEAVAEHLRQLGCDQAQGYRWAKPLALPEFLDYLELAEVVTEPWPPAHR